MPDPMVMFEEAKRNNTFKTEAKEADPDKYYFPIFPSRLEKIVIATMYYGWLIGKYGKDWNKIKQGG